MHMPQPTEQHRKLQALTGEWLGDERFPPSAFMPSGGVSTSVTTARREMGGFFVITDYVQKRDGQDSYRGHGVFGFEPRQQKFTMHWFDVMGGNNGPPALGTWEANRLTFEHAHHLGHTRYTYDFAGDGLYAFKIENSGDGNSWATFLEGQYRRK